MRDILEKENAVQAENYNSYNANDVLGILGRRPPDPADPVDPPEMTSSAVARTLPPHVSGARMTVVNKLLQIRRGHPKSSRKLPEGFSRLGQHDHSGDPKQQKIRPLKGKLLQRGTPTSIWGILGLRDPKSSTTLEWNAKSALRRPMCPFGVVC